MTSTVLSRLLHGLILSYYALKTNNGGGDVMLSCYIEALY